MMRKDRKSMEVEPENFPLALKESKFKPKQLFCCGQLPPKDSIGVAMVGTRRPGSSAKELCQRLVKSLQGTNVVVVSGLAQGIDSYCHEAALEYGISTIAVIAQGFNVPIPGERRELAKRIVDTGGCILTEFENDFPAYKGNFPARNRIISGLCSATVLVQSKLKGGALITADYCLQENKPLLAVPGDFDSEVASGPNFYLDQGKAKPIFLPESLRVVAGIPKIHDTSDTPCATSLKQIGDSGCALSPDALALFKKFNGFRKTFSELQRECNFKTGNILAILTELELAGLVETRDNYQFYFNGIT
ncbi:DNA-processing protein DprA [uncultured Fibrobacter sp.]|uniref:DNA-processing protein DprA n=1 Tax=uncultured Fibrobacter sp. TaxID=261512 RepID=UPI00260792CB|nr:DNA-processing protein DprA [uncultured Fibrobacter sp.]